MPNARSAGGGRVLVGLGAWCCVATAANAQVSKILTLYGEGPHDRYGRVAVIGDLDGDGVQEFLVGAPRADDNGFSAGAIYLYSGRTATLIEKRLGDGHDQTLGLTVSKIGDANGDGYPDFVAAAPSGDETGVKQYVRLYSGAYVATGALPEVLWDFAPTNDGDVGRYLGAVGDVDGDGGDDLLVGCGNGHYHFYVVSGKTGATIYDGSVSGASDYGLTVDGIGDVNGDGVPDFVVGSYAEGSRRAPESGLAWVYSGGTTSKIKILSTLRGDGNAYEWFGSEVRKLGDLDGDGVNEFAVGACGTTDAAHLQKGYVKVFSGATRSVVKSYYSGQTGDLFGWWVGAGDLNGDSKIDLVVSAREHTSSKKHQGEVIAYSGADDSVMFDLLGYDATDEMGRLDATGDFDLDGKIDLLIGDSPARVNGIQDVGAVYLLSGSGTLADSANYGSGYAGTSGVPTFTAASSPALGATFDVVVGNSAEQATIGCILIGTEAMVTPTTAGGAILSNDLVNVPITFLDGNDLPVSLDVPYDVSLTGNHYYLQALVVDPGAKYGISFSDGIDLVLGGVPW